MLGRFGHHPATRFVVGAAGPVVLAAAVALPSGCTVAEPTQETLHPVLTPVTYSVARADMRPRAGQPPVGMNFGYNWFGDDDRVATNGDGGLADGTIVGVETTVSTGAGRETTFCGQEGQEAGPPLVVLATVDSGNHVQWRQEAPLPLPPESDQGYAPSVMLGVVGTGSDGGGPPQLQCGAEWGTHEFTVLSQPVGIQVPPTGATYTVRLVMGDVVGAAGSPGARFGKEAVHVANVGLNGGQWDYPVSVQDVMNSRVGTLTLNGAVPSPDPRLSLLFFDQNGGRSAKRLVVDCGHRLNC